MLPMLRGAGGRLLPAALAALVLLVVSAAPIAAHTGEEASLDHILVEVGTWALAAAGVIALVVGVFWLRARAGRR